MPENCCEPRSLKWYPLSAWRGGSQAIRIGSYWLWVDHRPITGFDGSRNLYIHRFTLGDEDLTRIIATSPPFVFRNYSIEFCAGLAIDGDKLVLSYSMRDAFPFLAIVDAEAVIKTLECV